MKTEELLHKSLDISPPWNIVRVREDLGKQQIDVWVARQTGKSWFFGSKSSAIPEDREMAWRHVNLGGCRCVVHAVPNTDSPPLPWVGEPGMPFTHGMSRMIAAMMRDGIKLQSICAILDITVADLWKFKHTLDSGKAGLSGGNATTTAIPEASSSSNVPDPDSPIWEKLLDGSANIDIRLLGLKFLLTKLREQMRVITDPEVRTLKAYELQRYFARYEQTLGHELAQLSKL